MGFADKVTNLYKLASASLVENGILPSQYSKFILLTGGRTGSNLVLDSLSQHPGMQVYYEVFNCDNQPVNPWLKKIWTTDPLRYLRWFIYHYYPPRILSVGFSIHYYHCQDETQRSVWEYLEKDETLRVIHLKRNLLHSYVSGQLARKTGIWHVRDPRMVGYLDEITIEIDPQHCLEYMEYTSRQSDYFDARFEGHPKYELWYENLSANFNPEIRSLQSWLGVQERDLPPKTYKQVTRPISEIVSNYTQVQHWFEETPWKQYFDELPRQ